MNLLWRTFIAFTFFQAISSKATRRIFNGRPIEIKNFPWIVLVHQNYRSNASEYNYCGGSILSQSFVLTAAHCSDLSTRKGYVAYGTSKLHDMKSGTSVNILHISIHPAYNSWQLPAANDIAIVEVSTPILFSNVAKPITLRNLQGQPNEQAFICGWGLLDRKTPTNILHGASVTVLKACADGNVLCTTSTTCSGDSGGPLVVDGSVIGILSEVQGSLNCDDPNLTGHYTNVPKFKGFIDGATRHTAKWV